MRNISPCLVVNQWGFRESETCPLVAKTSLLNVGSGVGTATGVGGGLATTGSITSTSGSSGVDPGHPLHNIETCPSPIGNSLDMLTKSWELFVVLNSSIFDMHRMMDSAA